MLKRQSPLEHAKDFPIGFIKKGVDGNQWIIKQIKKKDGSTYKRWVKLLFKVNSHSPKPIKNDKKVDIQPIIKKPFKFLKDKVKISFSVDFIFFQKNNYSVIDILYYTKLPKPVQNEVISYFGTEEFKKNFEERNDYNDQKTFITKITWLVKNNLLYITLFCNIERQGKLNKHEYAKYMEETLYRMSYSGSPVVNKYGNYLGEYKGRYGMHIDNNVKIEF